MLNLSTPLTVSLVGGVLFLVFVLVAALRFKKGKLPIVSAALSLLALAAAILGLFFHTGESDQAPSDVPRGSYSLDQVVLVYSGSIDPTDVTVDGKTASVDSIKVDTSLKEPLIVVKEDRVTLILPSRDYFTSQANR